MATLNQVRNAVDNQLASLWQAIQDAQASYHATHGHYWQGKRTHAADLVYTTAKDADIEPDNLDDKPTDETESWRDLFPQLASVKLKAVLRGDAYDGPRGQGYVATVRVRYNGVLYERSQNSGPETFRTTAWHAVDESED